MKKCHNFLNTNLIFGTQVPYGSGHKCSGVLISNFTVLTSASCLLKDEETGEFYDAEELKVAMGSLNRSDPQSPKLFITDVTVVKPHGRFSRKTFANNLAILEVFLQLNNF